MKQCKGYLLLILMLVPIISLRAEETTTGATTGKAIDFKKDTTTITADRLEFNPNTRIFTYLGNVKVINADLTLTAARLDGNYSDKNEITALVAKENVHIIKDGIEAKCNKASYDGKKQIMYLTESPEVSQNGSVLSADLVKIFIEENRTEAEGNVQVRMIQQDGGKNPFNK